MLTNQQDKQPREQGHQQRDTLIGRHVLRGLGQPAALLWVQVRQLWEGHFRVNVLVGVHAASARVAHSYFVVTDEAGTILASTPKITRQY